MIADALRFDIEAFVDHTRRTNPFFRQAQLGEASAAGVGRYLVSLRCLLGETPRMLARARRQADARGQSALAEHFAMKDAEESGHEVWAAEDIRVHSASTGLREASGPAQAIQDLCAYMRETIDRDPTLYLAYILFVEYFTVLIGGEFVQHLVNRCGLPVEAMSCILKHVEIDQLHTDEGLDAIDALVDDPRTLGPMREVLVRSFSFFDQFGEELALETSQTPVEKHAELRIAV